MVSCVALPQLSGRYLNSFQHSVEYLKSEIDTEISSN